MALAVSTTTAAVVSPAPGSRARFASSRDSSADTSSAARSADTAHEGIVVGFEHTSAIPSRRLGGYDERDGPVLEHR